MDLEELMALQPRLVSHFQAQWGTDADDIAAEAVEKAAEKIMAGESVTPSYVWIAARSRAIDLARRRANRHESPDELRDSRDNSASLDIPPEGLEEATEDALGRLTDRQAAACALQASGYSLEEIGQRMRCTASSAAHLIHRAHLAARGEPAVPVVTLSPRELETVKALADGLDHAETALRLGIKTETVRSHLARIYAKLRVTGAAAAVARALRTGLIE